MVLFQGVSLGPLTERLLRAHQVAGDDVTRVCASMCSVSRRLATAR
jgi:hypothetical protein